MVTPSGLRISEPVEFYIAVGEMNAQAVEATKRWARLRMNLDVGAEEGRLDRLAEVQDAWWKKEQLRGEVSFVVAGLLGTLPTDELNAKVRARLPALLQAARVRALEEESISRTGDPA